MTSSAAPTPELDGNVYHLPPQEIIDIVEAPPRPEVSVSPRGDKILVLKPRSFLPLEYLARPEEKLAGVGIDVSCNARSRMSFYTGLEIQTFLDDGTLGPKREVNGFPEGAMINTVTWSHDGQHLSFNIRVDEEQDSSSSSSSKLQIWVADVESAKARPLIKSPNIRLNAIFDKKEHIWVDNSTLLVCTIPHYRGSPPERPLVPRGPKIQSNENKNVIQARTYQGLLKDEYDEGLFDYYATSQLVLAYLDGTTNSIGSPAVYTSIDPSPDKKYILVSSIHRPYSFVVPYGRFPKKVELWNLDGTVVKEICDLPLAEDIPIASDSVRKGKRLINWRADKPSTLYWVETQDEGDVEVVISPRDIVYMQSADSIFNNEEPEIFLELGLRYGKISWCDDSLALVNESWKKTTKTRTWVMSPGNMDASPWIFFEGSSEDAYSDPGSPMSRRTSDGTYVIAKIKKDEESYILLNGRGATSEGDIPFLDLFDIAGPPRNIGSLNIFFQGLARKKERIWESDKDKYYERTVALMMDYTEKELDISKLKILTSKESKSKNTQYYIQNLLDKKTSLKITDFPHPYPGLKSLQKKIIHYKRKDGVELTATLYLPPGYDSSKDEPLPCLVWAYPNEFKSKKAASQVRGSPNEFPLIKPTSPLLWLARGFAVLEPNIPIIGEGDEEANYRFAALFEPIFGEHYKEANEANDRCYVEQLVAGAEAAVIKVIKIGVAHLNKIAIGGHSYGAFMTANLLVHAPYLFSCGIARSGAYNRTLTPFGFQNEERTLWKAKDTYLEMSPFLYANRIQRPILLVHGEEDMNSGTLTMQSYRFFNALQGHGASCRLVILPFEGHNYSARESIMHVLWESDCWLQKYCVNKFR